jgi:hypothetical protein
MYVVTVQAEFDVQVMLIRDDGADCQNLEIEYAEGSPCQEVMLGTECHPSSADYIWIAPQYTTPFECGGDHSHYWVKLQCFTCDIWPGACCIDGVCYDEMTIWDCVDQGGTFLGEFTACTPDLCARPAAP